MTPTWDARVTAISDALAELRCPCAQQLPDREALAEVVALLRAAMFADQLGLSGPGRVPAALDRALTLLAAELARERPAALPGCDPERDGLAPGRAREVALQLGEQLPALRALLVTDLAAAVAGDPAAHDETEVLVAYPGFHALLHHRVAHALWRLGAPLIARIVAEIAHSATGIDIHPGAQIGARCFIDHGTGVVIGETAIVGAGARIYQGVTLGARSFPVDADGQILRGAPRHPILEDDVTVYAGATVLGRITIGRGSQIGGGVWLTRSVPPGSRILQAAAVRVERFEGGSGI